MPKICTPLTDTAIRNAKPREKTYTLGDGEGMYLEVMLNGTKFWRMAYRQPNGRKNRLTFGKYPVVSLAEARTRRLAARRLLDQGIDPKDVLSALRRIEARGAIESAHKIKQLCGQVFRFAVASGLAERDVTVDLRGALSAVPEAHYPVITEPEPAAKLLRAIDAYNGHAYATFALKLAPLVFVRPGELRTAEWSEIDFDAAEWRIPCAKMKIVQDHIVPLATQIVTLLRELHAMTGHGKFVFPSVRTSTRCMSENTVNAALRGMGYGKDVMTGHGFRAMARTIMDEVLGERVDLIEHQLAHAVKDPNGRAYNRTAHLPAR